MFGDEAWFTVGVPENVKCYCKNLTYKILIIFLCSPACSVLSIHRVAVIMPQTNKSVSSGGAQGQASAPDQGEPPPQDARNHGADGDADGGVDVEEQGDAEIVRSPSDPKKYRWESEKGLV